MLQKVFAGIYPPCMIVGSSGQGVVLPQENLVPSSHVALLKGKVALSGWRSAVFSDESRFCIGASDDRVLVSRRPGKHLHPSCLRPRQTEPTPGIMSVDVLPWPKRSPDLSLIEHVWDGGKLQHNRLPALTFPVLTQLVQKAWNFRPQRDFRYLYDTIHAHLQVCIQNSGGYIGFYCDSISHLKCISLC
ncbi:transposable element Tc1 transposase [Trichonephila clavipes]|nr:transposable element Tc1 transposase [Trichonephila clavipes]